MVDNIQEWIGREQVAEDIIDSSRSNALSSALSRDVVLGEGDPLPALHHWLYFWDVKAPVDLGVDGHPAKGGFLPPVALPRRMWAGGRLRFHRPLLIGSRVTRKSTVVSIDAKTGRAGALVFVTVSHELHDGEGVAISEEQDIVYREPASGPLSASDAASAPRAAWVERIGADPVLLFRYSALTMNGHRIHYDRPYATQEEAYPALVVQGPLQATMLAEMAARRLGSDLTSFDFRGQQPAFDVAPIYVCGEPVAEGADLWTEQGGTKCMVATARVGEDR